MKLFEKALEERAATYFLDELAHCGDALAAAVRAVVLASSSGRWSVIVPEVVNGDLWSFRTGGKFPSGAIEPIQGGYAVEVPGADEYLADLLANLAGTSTLAFEAVSLRREDIGRPWLAAHRIAMIDESVVLIADRATATQDHIDACFGRAMNVWYGLAIASEADIGAWPGHRVEWTNDDVLRVAAGMRCAALSVYDGESYLLWRSA